MRAARPTVAPSPYLHQGDGALPQRVASGMASSVGGIVFWQLTIDANDPARLARFCAQVLNYEHGARRPARLSSRRPWGVKASSRLGRRMTLLPRRLPVRSRLALTLRLRSPSHASVRRTDPLTT